jgi:hypothetical protein
VTVPDQRRKISLVKAPREEPRPHRLAREMAGSARGARLYATLGTGVLIPMAVAMGVVATVFGEDAVTTWERAATLVALVAVSWIRHRRYAARARWIRETPRWWERLDEAPTLLLFPRTTRLIRRVVDRGGKHPYWYE